MLLSELSANDDMTDSSEKSRDDFKYPLPARPQILTGALGVSDVVKRNDADPLGHESKIEIVVY